jgi:hypothetical protein
VPVTLALALLLMAGASSSSSSAAVSSSADAASTTVTAAPGSTDHASFFVELPLALSAHGTASKVETVLAPWVGVRGGVLSTSAAGWFTGGDLALLVGTESGGTSEVNVSRVPLLLEGRGLVGGRFRGGFVGLGGYGYGALGLGGGATAITAFDDGRVRPFGTLATRIGLGTELSFGLVMLRLELGTGMRDLRFELHGATSLGLRFD